MGFGQTFSSTKSTQDTTRLATDQSIASLARPVVPLSPESPIGKAIETLRSSTLGSAPVVSGSRLIAMLSENDLSSILLALPGDEQDRLRTQPISSILDQIFLIRPAQPVINSAETISTTALFFNLHPDATALGIVDSFRTYVGVVSRIDILAYKFKTLAPARVGGMATPLGVYLTDGIDSGGVGDLGLFIAGATLTSLFVAAMALSNGIDIFALQHHFDINAAIETRLMPFIPDYAVSLVTDFRTVMPLILMFLFLRLIPVAGYHAAEHQVVHCIERGEPLLVNTVARMPRPHPRCGTNLVSAVMLFGLYLSVLTGLLQSPAAAIVPAALATLLSWRQVGTFLQQYFTTRPASEKQLLSGIRAGQDLLSKYRRDTNRRANWPTRLWRMGLAQMLAGSSIPALALYLLDKFVPVVQPYLQGIY